MNARRILISLYLMVMGTLAVLAGTMFYDARQQYIELKKIEAENRSKLAEAQARVAEQQKILERLKTDPAFVEKVMRHKLGWAKPGEVIFRFEN